jgi:asparagine synthase (glutamine-hydrolysing)
MCGIAGIIGNSSKVKNFEEICFKTLEHRGPDGKGSYENEKIQLAHTRLSIIDLSIKGKQPMSTDNDRYVIVFNGEIYNYKEIKEELKLKGENFYSESDTEVVLKSFKIWGKNCLNKFEGMFAFLIWDNKMNTAFFARDKVGEKPFLFSIEKNNFIFASEYKALTTLLKKEKKLNFSTLNLYLNYNYTPEPHSLLEDIEKLPAGHYGFFNLNEAKLEVKEYWSLRNIKNTNKITEKNKIYDEILNEIEKSVELTLTSDVPVMIALSSGIDSSLIASIIKKRNISAITIGYGTNKKNDELENARKFCNKNNIKFNGIKIKTEEFVNFFPELIKKSVEPIADPALYIYYRINHEASKLGFKVLINGNGADEIFYGYDDYNNLITTNNLIKKYTFLRKFQNILSENIKKIIFRLIKSNKVPLYIKNILLKIIIIDAERPNDQLSMRFSNEFSDALKYSKKFYGSNMSSINTNNIFDPLKTTLDEQKDIKYCIQKFLFKSWLTSNIFRISDGIGMSVSVENRSPYVNSNLISKLISLNTNFKPNEYFNKKILKMVAKNKLTTDILEMKKQGAEPPVNDWIVSVVNNYKDILNNGILEKEKVINYEQIEKYDFKKKEFSYYYYLYKLIILEFWCIKIFKD